PDTPQHQLQLHTDMTIGHDPNTPQHQLQLHTDMTTGQDPNTPQHQLQLHTNMTCLKTHKKFKVMFRFFRISVCVKPLFYLCVLGISMSLKQTNMLMLSSDVLLFE